MALNIYVLKNTVKEAFIAVIGNGTATLKRSDLCYRTDPSTHQLLTTDTTAKFCQERTDSIQTQLTILGAQMTGDDMGELRVIRKDPTGNDVTMLTLVANPVVTIKADGEINYALTLFGASDMKFTTANLESNQQVESYFIIRKINYQPFAEPATFGAHDDLTKHGS